MDIEKDTLYHLKISHCNDYYFMDMYFRRMFVNDIGCIVLNFSDSLAEDAFFVNLPIDEVDIYISPYYPPEDVIRPRY